MVFAEDIRKAVLKLANQRGPGNVFYASEVARLIAVENWVKQVDQVRLVAETLVHEGHIISSETGKEGETAYTKASLLEADS